jgi:hypothetical protein
MPAKGSICERRAIPTAVHLDNANGRLDRNGAEDDPLDDRCTDRNKMVGSANTSVHTRWQEDPVREQRIDRASEVTVEGRFIDVVHESVSHFVTRGIRRKP